MIGSLLDLHKYPIDRPGSPQYQALVERCRRDLARDGMFNLEGFLKDGGARSAVGEIEPVMRAASFLHKRQHNIYFRKEIEGLTPDHPALRLCETINHTVCGDQLPDSIVGRIYEFAPLVRFLSDAMDKPQLYLMDDPLARINVMAYRDGEALNWHFDRSEFTVTLLLQAPSGGGDFQYRSDLRSDDDPNYAGVARLLEGNDPQMRTLKMAAGTLNVFRGKNTAHRVSTIRGERERLVTVFSYYERPGVMFSEEERIGFFGRAA